MIRDVQARNASLDNDYGPNRGPAAAASHTVLLLDSDGVELNPSTAPGYVRASIDASDWPDAVDGVKAVNVQFGPPTDEWPPVYSWLLLDSAAGTAWDQDDFTDPLLVTAASDTGPTVTIIVYYSTAIT